MAVARAAPKFFHRWEGMPPHGNTVSRYRGHPDVLRGGRGGAAWSCSCGEADNWAARIRCRGCAKDAPERTFQAALRKHKEAEGRQESLPNPANTRTFGESQVRAANRAGKGGKKKPKGSSSEGTAELLAEMAALREYVRAKDAMPTANATHEGFPPACSEGAATTSEASERAKERAYLHAKLAVLRQYDREQEDQKCMEQRLLQLDAEELRAKSPLERAQRATKEAREADKKLEILEANLGRIEADQEKVRLRLEAAKLDIIQAKENVARAHEKKAAAATDMAAKGPATGHDDPMGMPNGPTHADAVRAAAFSATAEDLASAGFDAALLGKASEFLAKRIAQSMAAMAASAGQQASPTTPSNRSRSPAKDRAEQPGGVKRQVAEADAEAVQKAGGAMLEEFMSQHNLALGDAGDAEPGAADGGMQIGMHEAYMAFCSRKKHKL